MASDPDSEGEEFFDPDDLSEIHQAIVEDDIDLLRQALEAGVQVNKKFTEDISVQHEGMTPLALGAALNKVEAVKLLLTYQVDVNDTFAALKTTALMTSSFHGHAEIVRLLLKKGADVRIVDLQGSTALGYAFGGTRDIGVISQLIREGVDVNQKNMLGMNALLLVAGYGDDKMVKMVLDAGADANAMNDFGHTALHLAIVGKRSQMKKLTSGQTGPYGLNRRNIDLALKEWARLHKDEVRGKNNDNELESVGKFMMNIGSKLNDPDNALEDDQEAMNRRVEAVWRYRQEKSEDGKGKKKGGGVLDSFLSCGGKRSKKAKQGGSDISSQPFVPLSNQPVGPLSPEVEHDITDLVDRCTRVLRLIIDAGCKIDAMEKTFGVTALDMAILLGDVESTAVLIAAGADASHLMKMFAMSDLYEGIVLVDKKRVKDLTTNDHDIDVNEPFTQFNATRRRGDGATDSVHSDGLTPLTVAAQMPDADMLEIMKMLIKQHAEINKVGPGGSSPLAEASRCGNLKMVQFLVQQGADVEIVNPEYKNATPVVIAAMNKHEPIVDFLIQKGAKVDKLMSDNSTAVIKASENDDQPMIEKLLAANLTDNYFDKRGFMYEMAERFQKPDKDVSSIMRIINDERKRFVMANRPREEISEEQIPGVIIKKAIEPIQNAKINKAPVKLPVDNFDLPIPPRGGMRPTTEPEVMIVDGHKKKQPVKKSQRPPTPEEEESSEEEEDDDEEEDEEEEEVQPPPIVHKKQQQSAPVKQQQPVVSANKSPAAPSPAARTVQKEESEEEESEEEESEEEDESEAEEEEELKPVPFIRPRQRQEVVHNQQPVKQEQRPALAAVKQSAPPAATHQRPASEDEDNDDEDDDEEEDEEEEEEEIKPPQARQPIVAKKPEVTVPKPQAVPARKPEVIQPKPQATTPVQTKQQTVPPGKPASKPPQPESESESEESDEEEESEEEEEEMPPPPPVRKEAPPVQSRTAVLSSAKLTQNIAPSVNGKQPIKLTMPAKFDVETSSKTQKPQPLADRNSKKTPVDFPAKSSAVPQKMSAFSAKSPASPATPSGGPPPLPSTAPPVSSEEEEESDEDDEGSFEEEDRVPVPQANQKSVVTKTTQQYVSAPAPGVTRTVNVTTTKTVVSKSSVMHQPVNIAQVEDLQDDDDDDDEDEDDEEEDEEEDDDEDEEEEYDARQQYSVQQKRVQRALHTSTETDI